MYVTNMLKAISAIVATWLVLMGPTQAGPAEKPFAEHKVVLQISDDDPFKQTLVLNVANNLIKHYGGDKIDIEIVAFGPGLRLLFAENANQDRINALIEGPGVRFAACKNTITAMSKQLGETPSLHPAAVPVEAGVVRIMELTDRDYLLIKP